MCSCRMPISQTKVVYTCTATLGQATLAYRQAAILTRTLLVRIHHLQVSSGSADRVEVEVDCSLGSGLEVDLVLVVRLSWTF